MWEMHAYGYRIEIVRKEGRDELRDRVCLCFFVLAERRVWCIHVRSRRILIASVGSPVIAMLQCPFQDLIELRCGANRIGKRAPLRTRDSRIIPPLTILSPSDPSIPESRDPI